MLGNPDFNALLTTTLFKYRKTLQDNFSTKLALWDYMTKKGRKRMLSGGEKIHEGLMYAGNNSAGSYGPWDSFALNPIEGVTTATFNWKQVGAVIYISGLQKAQNSGDSAIVNLLSTKMKQTEISLNKSMATQLYADGTGNLGKDILGLQAIVADTPTSGILAGIDRADNSWWQNQYKDGSKTTDPFDNLLEAMRELYMNCSIEGSTPDFLVADPVVYRGYEGLLVENQRFVSLNEAASGFENLKYKGGILSFDSTIDGSGRMYMLTTEMLNIVVHEDFDFKETEFQAPINQDISAAKVLWYGNLTVNNCQKQGVLKLID